MFDGTAGYQADYDGMFVGLCAFALHMWEVALVSLLTRRSNNTGWEYSYSRPVGLFFFF